MKIVECVPNFSEGRRPDVILKIQDSITSVKGIRLLNQHSDDDHNRTVFTFLGEPGAVLEAAFRSVQTAAENINLETHRGCHPRIGAADVVPFIPLGESTMEECIALSRILGQKIGDLLRIPVYLYGESALIAGRKNLEYIRKGEYEKLKIDIKVDPAKKPDFGPSELGAAGATVVGARKPLVAFNVFLDTVDLSIAKKIARKIRQSNGGLPSVKAMGVLVGGLAQISMNLVDYHQTNVETAFEAIRKEAEKFGIMVHHSELVGLIPEESLYKTYSHYIKLNNLSYSQVLSSPEHYFSAQERVLDDFSSPKPFPAGLCAAALSSAMAASLMIKLIKIIRKKEKTNVTTQLLQEIEILRQTLVEIYEEDQRFVKSVYTSPIKEKESLLMSDPGSIVKTQIDLMDQNSALLKIIKSLLETLPENQIPDLKTAAYLLQASLKSAANIARFNLQFHPQKEIQDQIFSEIAKKERMADSFD